jgi:hypothetical protein
MSLAGEADSRRNSNSKKSILDQFFDLGFLQHERRGSNSYCRTEQRRVTEMTLRGMVPTLNTDTLPAKSITLPSFSAEASLSSLFHAHLSLYLLSPQNCPFATDIGRWARSSRKHKTPVRGGPQHRMNIANRLRRLP